MTQELDGRGDEPVDRNDELGERLRHVRAQQSMSLQDVEEKSQGALRASVIGSYERGERAVSVPRLRQLAEFYKVPVSELLPDHRPAHVPSNGDRSSSSKVVVDLNALEHVAEQEQALLNYVQAIQARRGDYNGQVITMRGSDLETLAATQGEDVASLRSRLVAAGVIR
jgi:transcriptional regulator with XRE-family HTH domain